MKLEVNKYGQIVGYICSICNEYNDILRVHCFHCQAYRDYPVNHYQLEVKAILQRDILIEYEIRSTMDNEKRVELFSKFYAQAEKLIKDMSYEQMIAWEEELECIVIEAKASMQRSSLARRERQQKMTKEERDRLISNPEMSVSDGLLAPKLRKDRQSKADKLVADMAGMNIPPEMINALMAGINTTKTATSEIPEEKKSKGFVFNPNPLTKPNGNTQESLLEDLLSMVDLSSTDVDRLQERLNTAILLISKTVSKEMPEKVVLLTNRIDKLKSEKKEKIVITPSDIGVFDPSKLFGG